MGSRISLCSFQSRSRPREPLVQDRQPQRAPSMMGRPIVLSRKHPLRHNNNNNDAASASAAEVQLISVLGIRKGRCIIIRSHNSTALSRLRTMALYQAFCRIRSALHLSRMLTPGTKPARVEAPAGDELPL